MLVGAWQFGVQGYLVQRRRGGEGTVARASQEEGGERRPTDLRVEGWRFGKKWQVAVRWAGWPLIEFLGTGDNIGPAVVTEGGLRIGAEEVE